MAIKGSLKEASLPDVLQLLALGQKTGCLSIADRSNFGYIYFDKGRICYASIVNRRDRLGDILAKHGLLSTDQLDAAIHRQTRERDKKLGEILVAMGVISQPDLERYMRMQIEEAVYYLFTWTQGTFHFEADVRPEQQDFLVSINPESLLLEGARRVDEWSLIEKKIPSFDLIFGVDRDRLAISESTLTETQQRLMPLLDGSRDVNQVIEDSGLGEFEIRLLLTTLTGVEARAAVLSAGWDGDRYAVLGPGMETLVWYSVWDGEAEARRFADGLTRAWTGRAPGRPGRRWTIERVTIDGMAGVRLVEAPVEWKGWTAIPEARIVQP